MNLQEHSNSIAEYRDVGIDGSRNYVLLPSEVIVHGKDGFRTISFVRRLSDLNPDYAMRWRYSRVFYAGVFYCVLGLSSALFQYLGLFTRITRPLTIGCAICAICLLIAARRRIQVAVFSGKRSIEIVRQGCNEDKFFVFTEELAKQVRARKL